MSLTFGWSLAALGRYEEAWNIASESRAFAAAHPFNLGQFGYVAGASGHAADASTVLEELKRRNQARFEELVRRIAGGRANPGA
jgi:hypothetical protein